MAKKKKQKMRSMTAITWLLFGALLISWLACMACLTVITARSFYNYFQNELSDYYFGNLSRNIEETYQADREYYAEYGKERGGLIYYMLQNLQCFNGSDRHAYLDSVLMPNAKIPVQAGAVYYDAEGNPFLESGDYLYFSYTTQEKWDARPDSHADQYGYIKLHRDNGDPYEAVYAYMGESVMTFLWDFAVIRITGTMEGCRMEPVSMDYISWLELEYAKEEMSHPELTYDAEGNAVILYPYEISDLDRAGVLNWKPFMTPQQAQPDDALVTIYADITNFIRYHSEPISYRGETYSHAPELLNSMKSILQSGEIYPHEVRNLAQMVFFTTHSFRDYTDFDPETDPLPEPLYNLHAVVVGNPLAGAVYSLRYIYLLTGILMLLIGLFLRRQINRRLVKHIQAVNKGINDNWSNYIDGGGEPWREAAQLREHYFAEGDLLRKAHNEIARLNTALQYAKAAEENRRQMTSNIAHELKTPLAIIHSYSEGLKENINAEKKEQYLDTILSESERMDAMVLEMLDLSRLEAGKVKLQRDQFSLSALTKEIFDTFAPMAAEKGLQVTVQTEGDCPVVADEARIGQVIRNYASNAVRYTPEGGTILVRVRPGVLGVLLTVENSGCHFTDEELTKVWEVFYRSDKSRDRKGTGLGLAIVKNIIALHGGKCGVRNTQSGVEFSLILK